MSSERFSAGDTACAAHTHIEYDGVTKASVVEMKVVVIEGSSYRMKDQIEPPN